ncbi:MAG TPA: ABC transporter permease [Firmicutes bacterium]|nr:ABC transporter permease [Bacillota bacterium]
MFKYVLKRIGLMIVTFLIIMILCFVMIKSLPLPNKEGLTVAQTEAKIARMKALGYYEPIWTQLWIYFKNIVTKWDWGTSWFISYNVNAWDVIFTRLPPTMLINAYSILFSIPLGILLGIVAALNKNKWPDNLISVLVILFVSVPSFVYAFLVQYLFCYKLSWFPLTMKSLSDAGGSYWSWTMFVSMVPAIMSLSFGTVAGLTRFVRAELTDCLTEDYMILAKAKGLTNAQATFRHALNNSMVPVLPSIISEFVAIVGGSLIIENIFGVPGVGSLFINAINSKDYDVYMVCNAFYISIGLLAGILVDLSYGFIDPRIRMGAR